MKQPHKSAGWKIARRWLSGLLLAACLPSLGAYAGDSVRVITYPDRAGVSVDRNMLRAIYLMRVRQWPDGEPVHVFVLPDDSELHDRFAREALGTYPYVLRSTWDRMVFTGTGLAPTVVRSEQEMIEKVTKTPGAIGYVGSKPRSDARTFLWAGINYRNGILP